MSNLYTMSETIELCLATGFVPRGEGQTGTRRPFADVAAAIAMCESPGPRKDGQPTTDFAAIGDQDLANDTWGYSYGAWQVRSLREQKGTGGPRDETRLLKPRFNARSALTIYRAQGWAAWTTYTEGTFEAYLPALYPPAPNTYVVLAGDTLSGIATQYEHLTWQELADANGMVAPYRLSIGQVLIVPTRTP